MKDYAETGQLSLRTAIGLAAEGLSLIGETEASSAERKVTALAYVMADRARRGVQ